MYILFSSLHCSLQYGGHHSKLKAIHNLKSKSLLSLRSYLSGNVLRMFSNRVKCHWMSCLCHRAQWVLSVSGHLQVASLCNRVIQPFRY